MVETAKARPMCASLPESEGSDGKSAAKPTIEELNALALELSKLVDDHVATLPDTPEPSASITEARAAALSLIKTRQTQCQTATVTDSGGHDSACDAITKFDQAGRLDTSGVDIMATAFLTPKCKFIEKLAIYEGNEHFLAAEFNLPLSAIVLRKKMLSLYN